MTAKVNVEISLDEGVTVPEGSEELVVKCCEAVLQYEGFDDLAEVSVTFTDDDRIHELNKQFRNIDRATDVLSFPLGENGVYDTNYDTGAKMLGDVVISVSHAIAQAEEYGHSIQREIGFLTVHSMLHLLGYDHINNEQEEKEMFSRQKEILDMLELKRD